MRRRKIIFALCTLVALSGFAVLGNSSGVTTLLHNYLQNVASTAGDSKDNRSFYKTGSFTVLDENTVLDTKEFSPKRLSDNKFKIPEHMVYDQLFRLVVNFKRKAEQLKPTDDRGLWLGSYFEREASLSEEQARALNDIAEVFVAEISAVDSQARTAIERMRSSVSVDQARLDPSALKPTEELKQLQKKREEIALSYLDRLRTSLGPDDFPAFEHYVENDLRQMITGGYIDGSNLLPTESESSPASRYPAITHQEPKDANVEPTGCSGFYVAVSIVGYSVQGNHVFGFQGLAVDYFLGVCFDPEVYGYLDEICSIYGEGDLDYDHDIGWAEWIPAQVFLFSTQYHSNSNYTSIGENWLRHWLYGNRHYLGYLGVCIGTPPPCVPLNQSENGVPCPIPSITPTPEPTPTPPTVQVQEVGFTTGNHPIRRWDSYPTIEVIANPTWVRGGSGNHRNPVAYTQATNPTVTARLSITPTPSRSISASLRIKVGGNVATTQDAAVTLSGNVIDVSGISLNATVLENAPKVKKGSYDFSWEISFDNGSQWQSIGTSGAHIIYWTYAAPVGANCSMAIDCTFVNKGGAGFPGLYDSALEKVIEGLTASPVTQDELARELAKHVDNTFYYDPGPGGGPADAGHPLSMFGRVDRAQCSANANLLLGLLRSIGINAQTIYVWGGLPTNLQDPNGGKVYVYRYRKNLTQVFSETFKVKRPRSNEGGVVVERDPHFVFHAVVKVGQKYYDPSYGADLFGQQGYPFTEIALQETVDLANPNNPRFRSGSGTAPFVVRALDLRDYCIPGGTVPCTSNTVVTNEFCPHSVLQPPSIIFPFAMFDDDRLSDIAIWRPSDGTWWTKYSSDQSVSVFQFGQSGDQIVPGYYDGDGITDFAVFRPSEGIWYIFESESQLLTGIQWGIDTDIPVSGDFDGDGKTDAAVYRASEGRWYVRNSSDGSAMVVTFGLNDDKPVSADFDGDGKTDIAVYRPSNGTWYWLRSSDGGFNAIQFGLSEDIPVTGDYDGDHTTDIAVFRPSTVTWWILRSTGGLLAMQFGATGDIPVAADYDGDSKTDIAAWTPANGNWRILRSSDSMVAQDYFGGGSFGDIPVQAAFNR